MYYVIKMDQVSVDDSLTLQCYLYGIKTGVEAVWMAGKHCSHVVCVRRWSAIWYLSAADGCQALHLVECGALGGCCSWPTFASLDKTCFSGCQYMNCK